MIFMEDTGVRHSELGHIPTSWDILNFEEIAIKKGLIRGPFGGALKKDIFKSSGYKVYEQQNAIYKSVNLGRYYIDSIKYDELKRFSVNENDFILSCSGTIGRLFRIPSNFEKGIINQALMLIRLNSQKIDYSFFENQFNSDIIQNKILDAQGGAMKNLVGMDQIRKVKFAVPPLHEQQAIAACLTTWDEAIEKQTQLIAAKQQRKNALMQQLLSGKKRLPGFSDAWQQYSFSQLFQQVKRKELWSDENFYRLISVRRRSGGIFERTHLYGHQIAVKDLMKVKKNDFLISKMQIVHGASALVCEKYEDFYVSNSYVIVNIKDASALDPLFLKWYSKTKKFYHQTLISSYGVHIEKMTFDFQDFLTKKILLPSVSEQLAIVEILETADTEITLEKQKLAHFQNQKKGLMQQLLTGKVRLV